jgi:C-terminal processing protease CtpA/Prc
MKKKVLLEGMFFCLLSLGVVAIANAQDQEKESTEKPTVVKVEVEVTEDGETTSSVQEIELDVDHWNDELESVLEEMEVSIRKAVKDIEDSDIEIIIQKELDELDLPDFQSTISAIPRFHYSDNNGEERAFLGVEGTALDEIQKANTKLEKGVRITRVVPGSAAEAIGLQRGMIITSIDGEDVESFDELAEAIQAHAPKDEMKLAVYRDGKVQTQRVILGAKKGGSRMIHMDWDDDEGSHSYVFPPQGGKGGHALRYHHDAHSKGLMPNRSGGFLGIEGETVDQGVSIKKVLEATPEASSGLQSGDVITQVDETSIESIDGLVNYLGSKEAGEEITVRYLRNNEEATTKTTLKAFPNRPFVEEERSFRYEVRIGAVEGEEIDRISEQSGEVLDRSNSLDPLDLTIGPNPSEGVFMINLELPEDAPVKLLVFDAQGNKVLEEEHQVNASGAILTKLDLKDQTNGMYFLSVMQSGKGVTKRLIKQ